MRIHVLLALLKSPACRHVSVRQLVSDHFMRAPPRQGFNIDGHCFSEFRVQRASQNQLEEAR